MLHGVWLFVLAYRRHETLVWHMYELVNQMQKMSDHVMWLVVWLQLCCILHFQKIPCDYLLKNQNYNYLVHMEVECSKTLFCG